MTLKMPSTIDMSAMQPLPVSTVFSALFFGACALVWAAIDLAPHLLRLCKPASEYNVVPADEETDGAPDEDQAESGDSSKTDANRLYLLAARNKYEPFEMNVASVVLLTRNLTIVGTILLIGWINEYCPIFPSEEKEPNLDYFVFLSVSFILVALFTAKKDTDTSILNRNQTEEWKGWMQMQFLMYHYLHQEETYNAIRVYISCYVWMTGFGNFSFFYTRRDYGFVRFWSMMWRLNFSVFWLCMAMNNTYLLYYICPLHTFFFLMVFIVMQINEKANYTQWGIRAKLMILFCVVYISWEVDEVYHILWGWLPTSAHIGAKYGAYHEWHFRSALDHWDSSFGMIFALNFPLMASWLAHVETLQPFAQCITKGAVAAGFLLGFGIWYYWIFELPKFQYNSVHPYTFALPLLGYVYLRNCSQTLRGYNLELLVQMGKITLETYLLQHHFWLTSNAKSVLVFVPGYSKTNFIFTTLFFMVCARTLFRASMALRAMLIPDNTRAALKYLAVMIAVLSAVFTAAMLLVTVTDVGLLPIGLTAAAIAAAAFIPVRLYLSDELDEHYGHKINGMTLCLLSFVLASAFMLLVSTALAHKNIPLREVTTQLPHLKPLPETAHHIGHRSYGAVVFVVLCGLVLLQDNFIGLSYASSLLTQVKWPSWESVYVEFNQKILDRHPLRHMFSFCDKVKIESTEED